MAAATVDSEPPAPGGDYVIYCTSYVVYVAARKFLCRPLTGCLHVPIVGPTGRSDWSDRLASRTTNHTAA